MKNFKVELEIGSKTVKIESNDKELLKEVVASFIEKKKESSESTSRDVLDGYCEELNKSFESVEEAKKSLEETKRRFEEGHKERIERLNKAIKDAEEAIKENGKSIEENAQPEIDSIKGLNVDDAIDLGIEIKKELDDLFATLKSM
jgi:phage-related minor tail protein